MTFANQHAIVIGGSITGLLAARVLSDHFYQVTVIERDALPSVPAARPGVPQSRHLHGFLAGGVQALEALFPGFVAGAVARGAKHVDVGRLGTWYITGAPLPDFDSGLFGLLMSRIALEGYVRALVRGRANIAFRQRTRVTGLIGDHAHVAGINLSALDAEEPRAHERLLGDLVIDASGRGSRITSWLNELGVAPPREEVVRAKLTVSTCTIRRRPEHLGGADVFIYSPCPPSLNSGAAVAIEDDRYIVSMTSYLGAPVPSSYPEMIEFARELPVRGLDQLLESAEPLSEVVRFHDRESRRRRFDALRRFPSGILPMGDALCSFNPAYGQGITVAASEAELLDRWLRAGMKGGPRAFLRAASRLIDVPWSTIVQGDLQWPGVEGEPKLGAGLMNGLLARLVRAGSHDHDTARALLRVMHLVAPPTTLFRARILISALRHGGSPPGAGEAAPVISLARAPGRHDIQSVP